MPKGLPGAAQSLMRRIALVLNFVSIITAVIILSIAVADANGNMVIGPILLTILGILALKMSWDFLDDYRLIYVLVILVGSIALSVGLGYSNSFATSDIWGIYFGSLFGLAGLIAAWHYTNTIYKNTLMIHIGGALLFIIMFSIYSGVIGSTAIVLVILVAVALVLNLAAMQMLLKKNLLKLI